MNALRFTLTATALSALLAGCGGTQGALSVAPSSVTANVAHVSHGTSWMAPEAKGDDLLYATNSADVEVYSLPRRRHVGRLTGFQGADGACVDGQGNVYIVDFDGSDIVEYAHGGTNPINTLADPNAYPEGCSVDPTTGNLAVANGLTALHSGNDFGNLAIYQNAQGAPTIYTDYSGMLWYGACAYDNSGNLFIAGFGGETRYDDVLAEMPSGTTAFTNISFNQRFTAQTGIQFYGEDLLLANVYGFDNTIMQVSVSGSTASVVSTTTLNNVRAIDSFFVYGSTLIAPYKGHDPTRYGIGFWDYPEGGTVSHFIRFGRNKFQFGGVAVSVAPSHTRTR